MQATETTTQDTEQVMKQLAARERELSLEYLTTQSEHVALQATASQDVAAGGSVRGFAKKLAEAVSAIAVVNGAIDAIREQRWPAIANHRRAGAIEPRMREAEALAEASETDEQARPHLDALRSIQGASYVPELIPMFEGSPTEKMINEQSAAALGVRPREIAHRPTKSERLRAEAAASGRSAAEIERTADKVPASGEVEGSTLLELIDAIFSDPTRIGPRIPEVVEWIEPATTAARQRLAAWHRSRPEAANEIEAERERFRVGRRAGITRRFADGSQERIRALQQMEVIAKQLAPDMPAGPDAALTYRVVWRNGVLDEKASRAIANMSGGVPQLEPVDVIGGARR